MGIKFIRIMIQRIQSIYLGLIFILVGVMAFLPLVIFHAGDHVFYMNIFRFEGASTLPFAQQLPNIWPIAILAALLGTLAGISIFRYNNRKQQLKINMFNMLINFGLLVAIFLYADQVAQLATVSDKVTYDIAAYIPVITVLLLILSNRSIRKDDKLVRESDRLR